MFHPSVVQSGMFFSLYDLFKDLYISFIWKKFFIKTNILRKYGTNTIWINQMELGSKLWLNFFYDNGGSAGKDRETAGIS